MEKWSGLGANKQKSGIFFNKAAKPVSKARIKATPNLKAMEKDALYLGLPFFRKANKAKRYSFLIGRLKDKLKAWKSKVLSFAGRTTLLQAVAAASPTYAMASNLLSKRMCKDMDARMRDFWWGFNDEKKGIYLKPWNSICSPRSEGGLGIRIQNHGGHKQSHPCKTHVAGS